MDTTLALLTGGTFLVLAYYIWWSAKKKREAEDEK